MTGPSTPLTIEILGDTLNEGDSEQFTVIISNATNAIIGGGIPAELVVPITIQDDDGVPTLSIADSIVIEDSGPAYLDLTLSHATTKIVVVEYSTSIEVSNSAKVNDFVAQVSQLATIPSGTRGTISIPIIADSLDEGSNDIVSGETFTVSLSNSINATIVDGTAIVTIRDDDDVPELSTVNTSVSVREGGGDLKLGLMLSHPTIAVVTVTYATSVTSPISASSGDDFTSASGKVNIPAEITTGTSIDITILDDNIHEIDETFIVTLTLPSETDATFGNKPDGTPISSIPVMVTIEDNEDLPTISVSNLDQLKSVDEGVGTVNVQVHLSRLSSRLIQLNYTTIQGTAISGAGNDYTATSGTLNIPIGMMSENIGIPILADMIGEENESFTLRLSDASHATIDGIPAEIIVPITIIDDDPPSISIADATLEENSGDANLTITLTGETERVVLVQYDTSIESTDTANSEDFVTQTSQVAIVPTGTSTISIPIIADTVYEDDETFTVTLSNAVNATISDGNAIVTIENDDGENIPELAVVSNSISVNEGARIVNIDLTLSTPTEEIVTLMYTTSESVPVSAGSNVDFTASSTMTTIAADMATATVSIPIIDDDVYENNETFVVTLTSPSNATFGINPDNTPITSIEVMVTIEDNDTMPILTVSSSPVFVHEGQVAMIEV